MGTQESCSLFACSGSSLVRYELVDELLLVIHPLIVGSGKRLFREEYRRRPFELVDSKPTTKGVLVARYRAAS